ncbi:hypothetical protein M0811_02047 [Anaeramoeba ignava]|uniref:Uncharacterized protein n=1 Tax=Anaeramoeba ignava TaxID=1746090 RepID=A0A9Q0R6V9_ANAIG|nr:hypothetical protein M0811_02047 [Anaeramoeba ignava]
MCLENLAFNISLFANIAFKRFPKDVHPVSGFSFLDFMSSITISPDHNIIMREFYLKKHLHTQNRDLKTKQSKSVMNNPRRSHGELSISKHKTWREII